MTEGESSRRIFAITKDDDYLKNFDKQAEVHDLEKHIDQMDYKLYDLTPEKIAVVEGRRWIMSTNVSKSI